MKLIYFLYIAADCKYLATKIKVERFCFSAYNCELVSAEFPESARISYIYHNVFRPLTASLDLAKAENFNYYFIFGLLTTEKGVEVQWISTDGETNSLLLMKNLLNEQ